MDQSRRHAAVRSPITVMVVDDDLFVRQSVSELLGVHRDLRLTGVHASERQALSAALSQPPDVMVVDIAMPGMGGVELTRRLREQIPGIRVLAYTSLAGEQSLSDMLNAGAAGVVYKESSIAAVADAIRATAAGLSVLSPRFSSRLARPQLDVPLSSFEVEILQLISRGLSNEQIGAAVSLSPWTIKYHVAKLMEKLGATSRVTLAVAAVQLGLIGRMQAETTDL